MLAFIFWLTKQLLEVVRKNNSILAKLVEAINRSQSPASDTASQIDILQNNIQELTTILKVKGLPHA